MTQTPLVDSTTPTPVPQPAQVLSSSAKVGIGLGIPFTVLATALFTALVLRHMRHKEQSRIKDSQYLATPGGNNEHTREKGTAGPTVVNEQAHGEPRGIRELHQDAVQAYSTELSGVLGPVRG